VFQRARFLFHLGDFDILILCEQYGWKRLHRSTRWSCWLCLCCFLHFISSRSRTHAGNWAYRSANNTSSLVANILPRYLDRCQKHLGPLNLVGVSFGVGTRSSKFGEIWMTKAGIGKAEFCGYAFWSEAKLRVLPKGREGKLVYDGRNWQNAK